MNNIQNEENEILKFRYFFTSVYSHHAESDLKFKEKNYDDITKYVKDLLDKYGEDEYVGRLFIDECNNLLNMNIGTNIGVKDHQNAYKIRKFILEYFGELVANKFQPLEIGKKYTLKQIVWLFKILQENDVINNHQVDLIETLSALLGEKKGTIKTYLGSSEDEAPPCLFKNLDWSDLFS